MSENGFSAVGKRVDEVSRELRRMLAPRLGDREAQAVVRLVWHYVKGWSVADTFMHGADTLSDYAAQRIDMIYGRLAQDEPIQYIVGCAEFYGMELEVTPDTLIPRPETAELVDMIVDASPAADLHVLDACSGSGAIAIALARTLRFPAVDALELSHGAIEVARRNAARLKADVDWIEADLFTYMPESRSLDILVSNPPYVDMGERAGMDPNVLKWEPASALFVPDDRPLLFYERLAEIGSHGLRKGGHFYFEINPLHADALVSMLEGHGFADVTLTRDSHGKYRFASGIWR